VDSRVGNYVVWVLLVELSNSRRKGKRVNHMNCEVSFSSLKGVRGADEKREKQVWVIGFEHFESVAE